MPRFPSQLDTARIMRRKLLALAAYLFVAQSWASGTSLHTAYFAFDSDLLSAADRDAIRKLAPNLPRRPLVVVGYTDDIGSAEHNAKLAARRAKKVYHTLVATGYPARLLSLEARPAVHPDGNRRRMRRVEIVSGAGYGGADDGRTALARSGNQGLSPLNPLRVGRYSVIAPVPEPSQRNPLKTVVRVSFPPTVQQVGEALRYLLARSGWRLADPHNSAPTMRDLLRLPLPETQRTLGPIALIDAIRVLCGPAYDPVFDPVHRLVSCELKPKFTSLVSSASATPNDRSTKEPSR
jgi:type IV pili sensor histidine kinase/response regulator